MTRNDRLTWIADTLRIVGFVSRRQLMARFAIDAHLASLDLQEFQRRHPRAMRFDQARKHFVATREQDDGAQSRTA
ncbi:MAG TPA: hypothetical protein VK630_04235 [Reyranella sp.]|nr:hypothetical protein [Reyranella sp.]